VQVRRQLRSRISVRSFRLPLLVITSAVGVSALAASPASGSTTCGIPGAQRVAASGRLVVVKTPTEVAACIGSRRPYQLDTLSSVDGPCELRTARAVLGRYAGIDIRCNLETLDIFVDTIVSFDVARGRVRRGSDTSAWEDVRRGFVLASNGAFAFIEDFAANAEVLACDSRANCKREGGVPSRKLDKGRASDIGGLRVRGNTVSWRHGSRRRSARLL
jgi:hypothetical protein